MRARPRRRGGVASRGSPRHRRTTSTHSGREDRDVHRGREADGDRSAAGGERADHRDDLDEAGEGADEEPVRHADRPEGERQRCRRRAGSAAPGRVRTRRASRSIRSHVSRTSFRFGRGRSEHDEVDRLVALEDPVGGCGEDEEDPDDHLERRDADLRGRLHELGSRRQVLEALAGPRPAPRA